MSFFGSKGITSDRSSQRITSAEECEYAWRNHTHKDQNLIRLSDGVWSTNQSLHVDFSWCCHDNCQTIENLIVEEGIVATINGKEITTDLGDIGGCQLQDGECKHMDGIVIWQKTVQKVKPYQYKGKYKAQLVG